MSYFRTLVVNDVDSSCLLCYVIDPMQNVRIQNSLTNLVRDNKFFAIFNLKKLFLDCFHGYTGQMLNITNYSGYKKLLVHVLN